MNLYPILQLFTAFSLILLAGTCYVSAAPTGWPIAQTPSRRIAARGVPSAPHWVVYGNKAASGTVGPPAASDMAGYNTFIMSFLQANGTATGKAQEWTTLNSNQISNIKSSFASNGISLLVSAFGYGDNPTTENKSPDDTAKIIADWVKKWNVDGVDVDWEDFVAMGKNDGTAEKWVIEFIKQLRTLLPQGQYIITSAPIAPWFSPSQQGGGWLEVHKEVGDSIDWYNIQFYNQKTEYTSCDTLLNKDSKYPKSSVFEIHASGVPLDKIVIGKPAVVTLDADPNEGVVDPKTLASCLSQAKGKGWNAGVMAWQFPDADSKWIKAVRSSSWPV